MKRFLVTIITFLVLASTISAFEWKKVKTEVVSDHDYYEWISDQIVVELYVADYSKEKEAEEAKQYAKSVLARMFTATIYGTAGAIQAADNVYKSYGY